MLSFIIIYYYFFDTLERNLTHQNIYLPVAGKKYCDNIMSSEKINQFLHKTFDFIKKLYTWIYSYINNVVCPFMINVVWKYLKKQATKYKKRKNVNECPHVPPLQLKNITTKNKQIINRDILIDNSEIDAIDFDVEHNKNQYIRCAHNKNCNKNYHEILNAHAKCLTMTQKELILYTIGVTPMTIDIPIIFHLADSVLRKNDTKYWTKHINTNIISTLNTDYNRNVSNFSAEYTLQTGKLFANADKGKKDYYLNLCNSLPKNTNVTWKFYLKDIVIKNVSGLSIDSNNLDPIYKAMNVVDPDSFLNIIVVPGKQLLGISVFPFMDRDGNNETLIDSKYKYRNAVLINTGMFLGNVAQYNKYRTFTHEIGHWCGLLHPFDNDTCKTSSLAKFGSDAKESGDMIADTTPQFSPTFGTAFDTIKAKRINGILTQVHVSPYAYIFDKNLKTPNFLNFMDYTDDAQMCMFTHQQILKMTYMMARFRPNFVKY